MNNAVEMAGTGALATVTILVVVAALVLSVLWIVLPFILISKLNAIRRAITESTVQTNAAVHELKAIRAYAAAPYQQQPNSTEEAM